MAEITSQPSVSELRRRGAGKLIEKVWYPSGEFFSFFDFFFSVQKDSSPEVKGAWILAAEEKRRYVFTFAEFYMLLSELRYVFSEVGASSEIEINAFESRCLKDISHWDGPMTIRLSSSDEAITMEFSAHPLASSTIVARRKELLVRFAENIHRLWCTFFPVLKLGGLWFSPLGGAFSVFEELQDGEAELAIISDEEVYALRDVLRDWDGQPKTAKFSSLAVHLEDDNTSLSFLGREIRVSLREIEALNSFFLNRLFLSEGGNYSRWRDLQLTKGSV